MSLNFLKRIYEKKVDGTAMGLFRITYFAVLLFEVLYLYGVRNLVFDKIPYLEKSEVDFTIPMILWMVCIFFIIIGYKTKICLIINYIFSLCIIGTLKNYEYHMTYVYMGMNFVLIFLELNKNLAVDAIIYRYQTRNNEKFLKISDINYFIVPFVGIGLVYFDSIFHKLDSKIWTQGLGVWLPSSIPFATIQKFQDLLNAKTLMIFLGYFTLIFEFIFVIFFFKEKLKPFFLIVGIGLHIGITLTYPIPWFGLGMCAIYLTLIPEKWMLKLQSWFKSKWAERVSVSTSKTDTLAMSLVNSFDFRDSVQFEQTNAENSQSLKSKVIDSLKFNRVSKFILTILPNRFYQYLVDSKFNDAYNFKKYSFKFLAFLILFFSCAQLISILRSPVANNIIAKFNLNNNSIYRMIDGKLFAVQKITKTLFGITGHGVFVDSHFDHYNHNIAVVYKREGKEDIWLPIINPDGTPGKLLKGFVWAKWTFRSNNPNVNQELLIKSLHDFTIYWLKKSGFYSANSKFEIKVQYIDSPNGWEKDFLAIQSAKPWQEAGFVEWNNDRFSAHIKNIESIQ